jgi:poly(beta-D-mannuronate) lyase
MNFAGRCRWTRTRWCAAAIATVALVAVSSACGGSDGDEPAALRVSTTSSSSTSVDPAVGASLTTTSTTSTTPTTAANGVTTTAAPGGTAPGGAPSKPPTGGGPPSAGPAVTTAAPEPAPAPPATEAPPPAPPPPPPPAPGPAPGAAIDLTNWKLTLPVAGSGGGALEIRQPQLATFSSEHFATTGQGVLFTAPVEGATTSGSQYPRCELREMANGGSSNASWSSTSGTHVMEITQAITRTPSAKPHVVAGQIHDASDDVVMIRLEGHDLFVEGDGERLADLDGNYQLGTAFTVRIEASGGAIRVAYNGSEKLNLPFSGGGLYFKAGVYTQSNLDKGDAPGAAGQVLISALRVTHS